MDSADHLACGLTNLLMSKCLLECHDILLCYLCKLHGINKNTPGGRLVPFASYPFGQPSLHCFFIILGMGNEACIYCGCVKPHSFKNCSRLPCSFSAHMFSKEHEMACTICRESKTFTLTFLTDDDLHLYYTPHTQPVIAQAAQTHLTHTTDTHDGKTSLTSHR